MEGRKIVGWNVRKLRAAKGLTLEDLAARAETEPSHLAKLERGQINATVDLLDRLTKQLGAKLADLTVEPKPGETPPAPLKAGRRPRKQPTAAKHPFAPTEPPTRRDGSRGTDPTHTRRNK